MIIAQISDTHIDIESPKGPARIRDLEDCVADINRLDPLPDVVVHTGDVVHNASPAEYREAARILGALKSPLYVAAGNRDERAALRAAFPAGDDLLPGTPFVQYSVESFPLRLIVVDTLSDAGNKGTFCTTRADNLCAALADDVTRPTAVFMHHPPFEVQESKYPFQFETRDALVALNQALKGQTHVVRVFCGHTHRDTGGEIAGVPVSSMPSVAVDLRLGPYPEAVRATALYKLHRFDGRDGFVSTTRPARQRHLTPSASAP